MSQIPGYTVTACELGTQKMSCSELIIGDVNGLYCVILGKRTNKEIKIIKMVTETNMYHMLLAI